MLGLIGYFLQSAVVAQGGVGIFSQVICLVLHLCFAEQQLRAVILPSAVKVNRMILERTLAVNPLETEQVMTSCKTIKV